MFNLIFSFFPKTIPDPIKRRLNLLLPLLLYTLPAFLFPKWGQVTTVMAIFLAVVLLLMFIPPLFVSKRQGNYIQRMMRSDDKRQIDNSWDGSLVSRVHEILGRKYFMGIIYFLLVINLVYNAGKADAAKQKLFHVVNTSPEMVVLFVSNDKLVCSRFDRNTKKVEPSFSVITFGSATTLTLQLSEIGPLSLNTTPIYPTSTPTPTPRPTSTPTPQSTPTPTSTPSLTP